MKSKEEIWSILETIPDPEIPVISIVELGIARDVQIEGDKVVVCITPTYSGCPAMDAITHDIREKFAEEGIKNTEIKMIYSPVWTTDWIGEEAKKKLKAYGIAPPDKTSTDKSLITGKKKIIPCPRCGSDKTILVSQFGSTACKALYKCEECLEPFDYFKCH
ncbi:MAG: phenylacetate-CoA oxygenase subunit PaaJ [Bacteroidetes bacterium]|nr:MAG: phenylacetate-CoA oxygenase subunit PaaJ [Bacteroidota bacterium]